MNKLSIFGIGLTALYLVAIFLISVSNWSEFSSLRPNEWGDFLAGAFGPLAFFWLVLGYFQQGHELRNSANALKLQAKELRHSVEQQTALVSVTERQHQFEIEDRNAANERRYIEDQERQEREVPFLVLIPGNAGSSAGKHYQKFKVTNRSLDATKVVLHVGSPKLRPSPEQKISLLSGASFECVVDADETFKNFGEAATLTLKSYAVSGKVRVQKFSLSSTDYPLIDQKIVDASDD